MKLTSINLMIRNMMLQICIKISQNLGMLILSFLIPSTTFFVKLKIESLSGLTDLVVSITNVMGGLRIYNKLLYCMIKIALYLFLSQSLSTTI